jgi:membrane protein DedA with SNARE-associated domain
MLYLISSIIIGLIVYVLGKYTVMINIFMATFKVAAIALVIAVLILAYRKFRSRKRAGRPRRLLP